MNHKPLSRDALIDLAINEYFANVDRKRMDETLACFHPDAVFTVQSDFLVHKGRDTGIRKMFEGLFECDTVLHTDFETIADEKTQAVSSRFRVELEKGGNRTSLMSVNQWYVVNGKFGRVYVWIGGGPNVLL